jgi:carbonic anhydrase
MSVSGVNGSEATLQYMTFHSPSEHVFTDDTGHETRYALEIQFHHRQVDGRVVVVAVLFQVNSENKVLTDLFKTIPEDCKDFQVPAEPNLEDLFPFERNFYMYYGSLTTPPCTDSTTWYVMRAHSNLAITQLEAFRKAMKLDVVVRPGTLAQGAPLGTQLGKHKISLVDKDLYPDYGYSRTMLGNARPVQEFGPRKLWATPSA